MSKYRCSHCGGNLKVYVYKGKILAVCESCEGRGVYDYPGQFYDSLLFDKGGCFGCFSAFLLFLFVSSAVVAVTVL